jgi:hypothetical protein
MLTLCLVCFFYFCDVVKHFLCPLLVVVTVFAKRAAVIGAAVAKLCSVWLFAVYKM